MQQTEPGDLILVSSPGRGYALARAAARNPYDHIAVVINEGLTTNIDKPASRKLPVARLLREHLSPVVLRPVWRSAAQQEAFVAWMESLDGKPYDVARTLALIPRILLRQWLHIAWAFQPLDAERSKWICTDAVFLGLERDPVFKSGIADLSMDWNQLRCATTNDFIILAEERPDLLRRLG